jgi:anthranilate synthase component I
MQFTPSLEEFRQLATRGNVIPVFTEFIADCETPVSAFHKLVGACYSFLFESTEKNDVSGRYSFLGTDPRLVIQNRGSEITSMESGQRRCYSTSGDPLEALRKLTAGYCFVGRPDLPRFCAGAVGFLGYEAAAFFEPKIPIPARDELELPEMLFMVTSNIVVFDHRLRTLKIIVNAFLEDGSAAEVYARATATVERIAEKLARHADLPHLQTKECELPSLRSNFRRRHFESAVGKAKNYIRAGDVFQVVLSQRFECDFGGDPLELYRCLRFVNPSPYMFCLKFGEDFALVGSSPELHVRLVADVVEIRPIAGTRPRGATAQEDERNSEDLLNDAKERAEHIMLVDLARNDVGRIAEFGSVRVTEFMNVERYSHVMHIVSNVSGRLRRECDGFDVVRSTFPAGTVSGAPKIRAMQIIAELEQTRRGCYAGAIGYFGFDGNLDSCIALRSAILKNGKAYFQAGAGIVADSDPHAEFEETLNKAGAVARAIAMANASRAQ